MIIAIVGESASGKTRLSYYLQQVDKNISIMVSDTTRKPRDGEINGKDYYFTDISTFSHNVVNNYYIEYEAYSQGRYYGLSKREVDKHLVSSENAVVVLTPGGLRHLQEYAGKENIYSVYITASLGVRVSRYIERVGKDVFNFDDMNEINARVNRDYGMFLGIENEVDAVYTNDGSFENLIGIAEDILDDVKELNFQRQTYSENDTR